MASRRILVVEDNPHQRRRILYTLGRHLEGKPYLLEAADGRQAIALALHEKPDLILLDDSLPELSGTTVCQELKRDPETAPIKIVLLTVWDTRILDQHQADAYLAKPYNSGELLRMVEWILKQ
jgi:two-component system alkaline phosphatase synthesis response regulator PhoP